MSDYISRNAIIRVLNTMDRYVADELTLCDTDKKFPHNEVFIVDDVYEKIVEQLPPADVREIIKVEAEPTKGEWEFFDYPYMGYRCSKCGAIGNYDHKFCHDCGIEMKVEPTEE